MPMPSLQTRVLLLLFLQHFHLFSHTSFQAAFLVFACLPMHKFDMRLFLPNSGAKDLAWLSPPISPTLANVPTIGNHHHPSKKFGIPKKLHQITSKHFSLQPVSPLFRRQRPEGVKLARLDLIQLPLCLLQLQLQLFHFHLKNAKCYDDFDTGFWTLNGK